MIPKRIFKKRNVVEVVTEWRWVSEQQRCGLSSNS
jgi:hypothetical protein